MLFRDAEARIQQLQEDGARVSNMFAEGFSLGSVFSTEAGFVLRLE